MSGIAKKWSDLLFNTSNILARKRHAWVDYAKGIAIILVVYRHTCTGLDAAGMHVNEMLKLVATSIANFRMPMFFILSGVFISVSLKSKNVMQLIESKLNTIMYPYFIWAFIQVSLQIFLGRYATTGRTWHDYLYIFYEPHMLDQFWYLFTLFNVSVIYVICKVKLRFPIVLQLLFGLVLFHFSKIKAGGLIDDTFNYYFYFAVGDLLSSFFLDTSNYKLKSSYYVFLIFFPIFLFTQNYWLTHQDLIKEDNFLFAAIALVGCIVMFNVSFIIDRLKLAKWLRVVGNHSLYIYIMHLMAESPVRVILYHFLHVDNVPVVLVTAVLCGVAIPIVFYNLSMKAGLWFLYTYKKPASEKQEGDVSPVIVPAS